MAKARRVRRPEAPAEAEVSPKRPDAVHPSSPEAIRWEAMTDELTKRLGRLRERIPHRFWTLPLWSRWAVGGAAALAIVMPLNILMGYRSQVISSNAAVRGYVTEIGTRIDGLVSSVAVDVGDRVIASQVLVQLEDKTLRAQVDEARAQVAALEGTIASERTAVELDNAQIQRQRAESEAQIAAARANAEAWRIEAAEAARNHELQTQLSTRGGFVAAETLRGAESAARTAQARLQEAEANATAMERSTDGRTRGARDAVTIRLSRITVLEADLRAAQARLARAEADLESASIRAPSDGAIVRRIMQPGGAIEAGQPVISMWLGDDLWVESWIEEEELGSVHVGSKATVTFHALPGEEFSGTVERIGLATDLEIPDAEVPQPRFSRMRGAPVVSVRIRLDERPVDLLPGLSAVVAIQKGG
jgi:membrane fusion protein (multidrug efflux system)